MRNGQFDAVTIADLGGQAAATSSCMPKAARHARTAWSSNARGAPNTAMMPSPVNLPTVPP